MYTSSPDRSVTIILDNDSINIFLPDTKEHAWLNYHVTKHLINNYVEESFYLRLKIDSEKVKEIQLKQSNEFNCTVDKYKRQKETCNKCEFVKECRSLIDEEGLSKAYIDLILDGMKSDHNKPTHAHYKSKKSEFSKKMLDQLLFIDDYGLSIYCRKEGNSFKILTYFLRKRFSNTNGIQIKKIKTAKKYFRMMSIYSWNNKLQHESNHNVIKHIEENW